MSLYQSKTYLQDLSTAIAASVGIEALDGSRILITGATGTIGSFLVDMLVRYSKSGGNLTLYAAARSLTRLRERFDGAGADCLHLVAYDMTAEVDLPFAVDYVIHAAGNAHPAAFNGDPVGTILGNVKGTCELLRYAERCGAKRFLYLSTGEVYGQGDLSLDSFEESYGGYVDPTSPRSCYPNSKRTAETLCAAYTSQYGLETVIVRPCHTYGPGITATDNRANVQFMGNVLRGEDIVMKSPGTQMRSYCYVADCASAILTVLVRGESGQAYNAANPEARVTIAGFAQAVADAAGKRVIFANPTEKELADRSPIAKQVLSTAKLEALGWRGHFSVQEGVAHTLEILAAAAVASR